MSKIYTKQGDKGYSRLMTGDKLPKSDKIFHAIGWLDMLQAHLLEISINPRIISDLQDIMANLARGGVRVTEDKVKFLEEFIDERSGNEPLREFIIPKHPYTIKVNICRTICRTAERYLVEVTDNKAILAYINRLSDYLFIIMR